MSTSAAKRAKPPPKPSDFGDLLPPDLPLCFPLRPSANLTTQLFLNYNRLSGLVPTQIGTLPNFATLDLALGPQQTAPCLTASSPAYAARLTTKNSGWDTCTA